MKGKTSFDHVFTAPARTLSIGVTGHREGNPAFDSNRAAIEQAVTILLASVAERMAVAPATGSSSTTEAPAVRLVTNLANGADLMAAQIAQGLRAEVLAPLPFGTNINCALNMLSIDWQEAQLIGQGKPPTDASERANWDALKLAHENAKCFELCDQDEAISRYLSQLTEHGDNRKLLLQCESLIGQRTRTASRITVEQSDVLLAIWDGTSPTAMGGTRDTMAEALSAEVPVIWLDANNPSRLHWLEDIGDLAIASDHKTPVGTDEMLDRICENVEADWLLLAAAKEQLSPGSWRPHSKRRFHAYRRIEKMFAEQGKPFASVKQTYETPQAAAAGGAETMIGKIGALLPADPDTTKSLATNVTARFAAADGISTYVSDAYRGGMVASFLLSAAAIIGGVAYLPLVGPEGKWPFALLELALLLAIVFITVAGVRGKWHRRWFQTRRVAEYLRHAPIMVAMGCVRPRGHWPSSPDTRWPELYAREIVKGIGLPRLEITQVYLKRHLREVLRPFFVAQKEYHERKAHRLERVHHNLDRMSEVLFILAIISVSAYLLLKLGATVGMLNIAVPNSISKLTTFLGVAFPTLGAAIAGIRYFGDFERFAGISEVTASKLDRLIHRSDLLLEGQEGDVSYEDFVDLTRKMDIVVVDEIASWQSIFGTKKMSVPV